MVLQLQLCISFPRSLITEYFWSNMCLAAQAGWLFCADTVNKTTSRLTEEYLLECSWLYRWFSTSLLLQRSNTWQDHGYLLICTCFISRSFFLSIHLMSTGYHFTLPHLSCYLSACEWHLSKQVSFVWNKLHKT